MVKAAQPRLQATRLRLGVSGAIFQGWCLAKDVSGQKRRAPETLVSQP